MLNKWIQTQIIEDEPILSDNQYNTHLLTVKYAKAVKIFIAGFETFSASVFSFKRKLKNDTRCRDMEDICIFLTISNDLKYFQITKQTQPTIRILFKKSAGVNTKGIMYLLHMPICNGVWKLLFTIFAPLNASLALIYIHYELFPEGL